MSTPLLHALYRGNRNNSNRGHHRLRLYRRGSRKAKIATVIQTAYDFISPYLTEI